tara:strand:- start:42 stop:269 length:228 start_codon:yes stop_codon:yes gene_type:complete
MALVGGLQVGGSYKFSDLLKEKKTKKKKLIKTNTLKSSKCKKHKQEWCAKCKPDKIMVKLNGKLMKKTKKKWKRI